MRYFNYFILCKQLVAAMDAQNGERVNDILAKIVKTVKDHKEDEAND
jgi:hypothetical protein